MDNSLRDLAVQLRSMQSPEAVDWLLTRYPCESENWGEALTLIGHASFSKGDARRLAAHYLRRAPYASDRPYQVFAKLIGFRSLLGILGEVVPANHPRRDLLLYHLKPLLEAVTSDKDRVAASAFVSVSAQ
ncbi:hypothetical protein ACLIMP_04585 [Novosphingobium aerophilum]|uniref:hypothetical protein n=1 Tax=Novosphingobium TaxID=165696 RepID=UPI002D77B744|nr:hypothetical protein [Novosphingobium sp. RL4]WRT93515.1 hypothetical protein U9J33_03120 [Novosphingobium sp. RL4]